MYSVVADAKVRADLTALWIAAGPEGMQEARAAAEAIYQQLTTNPFERSESREGLDRIMFELPVGVLYSVSVTHSLVFVLAIWYVQPHAQG